MLKKNDTDNPVAVTQRYEYKICPDTRNWSEGGRGCGKLFTMDSCVSYCPDCGLPLSIIRLSERPKARVARVTFEKCGRCADNVYAQGCVGGKPPKPEYCYPCRCRACCVEVRETYRRFERGEVTLPGLMRDAIRKRREEAAKEAGGASGAVTEAGKKPAPGFKTIGQVYEGLPASGFVGLTAGGDEIPF
jgi:hypothetical protein